MIFLYLLEETAQWSVDHLLLYDKVLPNKKVCGKDFIQQRNNLDCSINPHIGYFYSLREGKCRIVYPYDSQIVPCSVLAVKEYIFWLHYKYTEIL